ncbi:MAG: biotin/lipoyl-containing protein, partial [Gammaproteobacteria bacterium]
EMNTRLQVEHPVTELATGLDLVEWQLRVAAGEPLPCAQDAISQHGHAFEVRIYAENTERDFLPATGRIRRFTVPTEEGVRVDTGVGDGDQITSYYDPMIAKLCVHAADRADAVMKLRAVLDRTAVFGLTTNLPLLRAIARHEDFAAGALDTGWVEREVDALRQAAGAPSDAALAAAAGAMAAAWAVERHTARPRDPGSPWLAGMNNEAMVFTPRGKEEPRWEVESRITDSLPQGKRNSLPQGKRDSLPQGAALPQGVTIVEGNELLVADGDGCWELEYWPPFAPRSAGIDDAAHPGAPMPGRIVAIHCKVGDRVEPGEPLLVLEAMKMEYTLPARTAGTIEQIHFAVGDMVDVEVPLVDIKPDA